MAARAKRKRSKKEKGARQARNARLQIRKLKFYLRSKCQPAQIHAFIAKRKKQMLPAPSPRRTTKPAGSVYRDSVRRLRQEMRRGHAELKNLIANGLAAFDLFRNEVVVSREDFKYVLRGVDNRLRRLEQMVLPYTNYLNEDLEDMLRRDIYQDPNFYTDETLHHMEEERFTDAFTSFCDDC